MYRVMLSYGLKLHKGLQVVVKPPRDWRYVLKQIRQSQVTVGTFVPKDDVSLWQRVTGLKFFVAIEGPDPSLKALPGSNAMGIQAYDHKDGQSHYKAEVIRLRLGKQPRKRRWVQQEQWQGDTWSVPRQQVEVELEPLEATEPPAAPAFPDVAIPSNGFVRGEVVDFAAEPELEPEPVRPSRSPKRSRNSAEGRFQDVFSRFRPQVRSNGVILSEAELEEMRLAAEAEAAARVEAYRDDDADDDYLDDDLPPSNAVFGIRDDRDPLDAFADSEDRLTEDRFDTDRDSDNDDFETDDYDYGIATNLPSNAVVGRLADTDRAYRDDAAYDDNDRFEPLTDELEAEDEQVYRDQDSFRYDDQDESLDYEYAPTRRRDDYRYNNLPSNLPSNARVITYDDTDHEVFANEEEADDEDDWEDDDYQDDNH